MTDAPGEWSFASEYDGGETGCGELIIDLHLHFRTLAGGTVVAVRALDSAAPAEMAAWCRTTGHTLLEARHPYYLIRRKEK